MTTVFALKVYLLRNSGTPSCLSSTKNNRPYPRGGMGAQSEPEKRWGRAEKEKDQKGANKNAEGSRSQSSQNQQAGGKGGAKKCAEVSHDPNEGSNNDPKNASKRVSLLSVAFSQAPRISSRCSVMGLVSE